MFHAPMGRFKLELIYYFTYFSIVIPSCPSQETEETSAPTRPVENVILTTKGLHERNIQLLDGMTMEK
jgi:hypothetical protein